MKGVCLFVKFQSEGEVETGGVPVGEMTKILLKKIEEPVLYYDELRKKITELENKVRELEGK